MTLGEKIRTLRKNAQLSQEALAEQLDVSRQAVSKWENDNGLPETEKLIKMAKLFHVSLDTFINDAEDIAPAASVASAEDEQLSLAAAEGYLDFSYHRCQRVGLAVLLPIASLGLTFFSAIWSCSCFCSLILSPLRSSFSLPRQTIPIKN